MHIISLSKVLNSKEGSADLVLRDCVMSGGRNNSPYHSKAYLRHSIPAYRIRNQEL